MSVVVVSAGLSVPSSTRLLGEQLAAAATGRAAKDARVIELRDLAVDIAHNFTSGFPAPALADAMDAVTGADGLIAVTPVFSASYSGLFKSFFDVLGVRDRQALAGKPVLIAATGGTPRHSLVLEHALRPLFAHLRAVVAPTGVYAASQDWGDKGLDARIERAGGELAALTAALTGALPAASGGADGGADNGTGGGTGGGAIGGTHGGATGDTFDARNVVPFEEQLAALRSAG
ncbi:CE1759 family FMN reductase [Streptomyces sp. KMM 9044]|uniref:CE1759 family FMN reductase n=1 Tax=Streptomyces sp. KMM 9044 TaxID=2744474 RepID=UPI002151F681|nr:CE1759 family FMN reductase [Streptomyces sp. KMM 9044]WAX78643.1 NAD(P)H-dependent oxidoreductase [Streptomyces sp. KMM 9044]